MSLLRYNPQIENAMSESLDDLIEQVESDFEAYELIFNEIEHKSRDGFIPFTNGGYELTVPYTLMDLNSRGVSIGTPEIVKQIDGYIENAYQSALEHFVDIEPKLKDLFTTEQLAKPSNDVINYNDLYEIDEGSLAEALSEIEYEFLSEGATLFLQYRIQYYAADNSRNETGEDEVCFLSGINLDLDYGRDKGLEVTYEQTVKISDLTPAIIKEHINGMQKDI